MPASNDILLCAGATECGPIKPVNQDAYLVKRAQTAAGDIALAVVADGMGGLQQGEVASGNLVRAFDAWFQRDLPLAGESLGFSGAAFAHVLKVQWASLLQDVNLSLMKYGLHQGISLGTACTAFFVAAGCYYAIQVGDTRLGRVRHQQLQWLTEDQTFAAQEVDAGRLSKAEAARHPLRNTLLQCVGASSNLAPVFSLGSFDATAAYVICSDGFRRSLTDTELASSLCAEALRTCASGAAAAGLAACGVADNEGTFRLKTHLHEMMSVAYARGQRDNATAVVVLSPKGESQDLC